MKRPEIIGWKVTTNENGIEMATLPRYIMEEILKYVEYADKQLRIHDAIGSFCECGTKKPLARCMDDRTYCADCRNVIKQYDR